MDQIEIHAGIDGCSVDEDRPFRDGTMPTTRTGKDGRYTSWGRARGIEVTD